MPGTSFLIRICTGESDVFLVVLCESSGFCSLRTVSAVFQAVTHVFTVFWNDFNSEKLELTAEAISKKLRQIGIIPFCRSFSLLFTHTEHCVSSIIKQQKQVYIQK
ncbi:MAG: hypothetical protein WCG21_01785 [Eubacteriales bacterium]